jgi:hypothetical protein
MFYISNHAKLLINNRIINNNFIDEILKKISKFPKNWSILGKFFGIHRLFLNKQPLHTFIEKFNIKYIPFNASVKFIHSCNHSCINKQNLTPNKIICDYKKLGYILEEAIPINIITKLFCI